MGEGGIIKQATDAKTKHEEATMDEQSGLLDLEAEINTYVNGGELQIPEELKTGDKIKWKPSGHYTWDKKYFADSDGELNSTLTKELYSGTEVPNGASTTWEYEEGHIDNMDMTIENWNVLKVDRENKKVILVPETSTPIVRLSRSTRV